MSSSSSKSNNNAGTDPQALESDLASVRRVRHRLAVQTSDADLPRIFPALLPRLLSKLQRNCDALLLLEQGKEEDPGKGINRDGGRDIRNKAQDIKKERVLRGTFEVELRGILLHAVERIKGNRTMNVTTWLGSVSDFVSNILRGDKYKETMSQDNDKETVKIKRRIPPGLVYGLMLLEVGVPRCVSVNSSLSKGMDETSISSLHSVLAAGFLSVDYLHKIEISRSTSSSLTDQTGIFIEDSRGSDVDEGEFHLCYARATWICLDALCLLDKIEPLIPWNCGTLEVTGDSRKMGIDASSADRKRNKASGGSGVGNVAVVDDSPIQHPAVVLDAVAKDGAGVMNLFLDVMLYHPDNTLGWGMSRGGHERMNYRINEVLNAMDYSQEKLINLKVACIKAIAHPEVRRGLFQGDLGSMRALVFLIIASASTDVPVAREAATLLNKYLTRPRPRMKPSQFMKKMKIAGPQAATEVMTVGLSEIPVHEGVRLAIVLLTLALGYEVAVPLLRKCTGYKPGKDGWECILGPLPKFNNAGNTEDVEREEEDDFDDEIVHDQHIPERNGDLAVHEIDGNITDEVQQTNDANGDMAEGLEEGRLAHGGGLRAPLPYKAYNAALDFIFKHLCKSRSNIFGRYLENTDGTDSDGNELKILLDLTLGLSMETTESTRLVHELCFHLISMKRQDNQQIMKWRDDACLECLEAAMKVLSQTWAVRRHSVLDDLGFDGNEMVDGFDDVPEFARGIARDAVGPNLGFHQRRRALENIRHTQLLETRARRARDRQAEVRSLCYDVVGRVGDWKIFSKRPGECETQKIPERFLFDIPALLFHCMIEENNDIQSKVAFNLDLILKIYRSSLQKSCVSSTSSGKTSRHGFRADLLQHRTAPLLPHLLSACCSDSEVARRSALRWTTELVRFMDPLAAMHLLSYLNLDSDLGISSTAKAEIEKLKQDEKTLQEESDGPKSTRDELHIHHVVDFLDYDSDVGKGILQLKLQGEIELVSAQLQISEHVAAVLLRCFKYLPDKIKSECGADFDGTIERCGIKLHVTNVKANQESARPALRAIENNGVPEDHCCGICFDDDFKYEEVYAMPCNHQFCRDCWHSYLAIKLEEGPKGVLDASCPESKCQERVTDVEILDVAPDLFELWRIHNLSLFVELNSQHRWCPGPDCSMVAISLTSRGTATCSKCATSFCFECGQDPHCPASCLDLEKWNRTVMTSQVWITRHTKPCPGCKSPIEKNEGCNHMTCSRCNHEFCWLCLGAYDGHVAHVCNQYDPLKNVSDTEGRKHFYIGRFHAHNESERFARDPRGELSQFEEQDMTDLSKEELDVVKRSRETVVEGRHFLKYTYVAAYFLGLEESLKQKMEMFESHQATLELFTEKLSALTEIDINAFLSTENGRSLTTHIRALSFHATSVQHYKDRMLAFMEKENLST